MMQHCVTNSILQSAALCWDFYIHFVRISVFNKEQMYVFQLGC